MKSIQIILFSVLLLNTVKLHAQDSKTQESNTAINGSLSITNNGISLIPTFSLGNPALLSNFSLTKNKLSVETDINFANDGKPWYTLFWLRYKVINKDKFSVRVGTHLGLNYKRVMTYSTIDSSQSLLCERYIVTEFAPNYQINKNFSVGTYYMFSHGVDIGTNNATHFLTLNANISNISLGNGYNLSITPQVYYLKIDKKDGYYLTGAISLAKRNSPFSISSVFNKVIHTTINPQDNFVYNFSLNYTFGKHKVL